MRASRGRHGWFPFTDGELQMAVAVYGVLITVLGLAGVEQRVLLWSTGAFAVLAYFAGLLVHAQRPANQLIFLSDGAVAGAGYADSFRRVSRCLYLMHIDDDQPSDELLGLYRTLLERGVQIRRTVFLRHDAAPSSYDWIVRFGNHQNLQHRVVLPEQASVMRHGFVVVDDKLVLLSVPGHEAIDGHPYTERLVLRHLLLIEDQQVASAFLRVHEKIWQHATPVADVAELASPVLVKGPCRVRQNPVSD